MAGPDRASARRSWLSSMIQSQRLWHELMACAPRRWKSGATPGFRIGPTPEKL